MKPRDKVTKRPDCENCGKPMTSNGWGDTGKKRRWICRDKQAGTICSTTRDPGGKLRTPAGKDKVSTKPARFARALGEVKRFIITSAQNSTPIHPGFFTALRQYCEHNNAELVVIPTRYKNPTSTWSASQANEEVWADELTPYLYNQRKKLCANLILMGDIKTQPTAVSPLTGFESISHDESAIFGHSKRQLRCIPTPSHALPKILATTGAVTLPNYTDSRAGKKSEFHHVLGATVVEIVGKKFHMRQITWDQKSESFQDWDTRYGPAGTYKRIGIQGLILGDMHWRFMDQGVERATFGPGGIVEQLRPEYLVWHDLMDGYAKNPHHSGAGANPFVELAKLRVGYNDVRNELDGTIRFLQRMSGNRKSVVVPSNHDDFLRRYIVQNDWRQDPANAEFYLETALAMAKSSSMGPGGAEYVDPFTYWIRKLTEGNKNIITPGIDESFEIAGVECGFHGHRGPNGARGSLKNLSRLGVKVNIGHCLTAEHMVLTESGWEDITTAQHRKLLGYADGRNVWADVSDKQQYTTNEPTLEIGMGKIFRQHVTKGHHLSLKGGRRVPIAEAIMFDAPGDIPLTAKPDESQSELFISDDTLRKVVAICADGDFYTKSLSFHLKKLRKISRIKELFAGDLLPEREGHNGAVKMTIRKESDSYVEVTKWVSPFTEGKRLPADFLYLSARQRAIFLDEVWKWDGSKVSNTGYQFQSSKKSEAYLVSAICTQHGFRNTVNRTPNSGSRKVSFCTDRSYTFAQGVERNRGLPSRLDSWGVRGHGPEEREVFCFTTSTGNFWVMNKLTGQVSLTGNSHTPGIEGGGYQAGTSSKLRLEYTEGPSSWMHAHILQYADGKRSLCFIINGEYQF